MSRLPRFALPAAALLALGYLAAMVVIGGVPESRQLVRFEAKGVLTQPPEAVSRVRLEGGGRMVELVRAGDGAWILAGGGALGSAAVEQVATAVKVMHRSGPVREIAAAEVADATAFELDRPALTVTVHAGGADPVLTARFGAYNPEGILQYMRLDGDGTVYLMSRFVAGEWQTALERIGPP